MTTATATKLFAEVKTIELKDIVSNISQTRGMGALPNLVAVGTGLFEKISLDVDKEPLWPMFWTGSAETEVAKQLLTDHEPTVVQLAKGMSTSTQLQPIGVREVDGGWDVIFGMQRAVAAAFNGEATIEAKVFTTEGEWDEAGLLLMGLSENNDRRDESPIDRAITYQRLKKLGLKSKDIAEQTGLSRVLIDNYVRLLSPKLEDKKQAIHSGEMSVDRALKLLSKREGTAPGPADKEDTTGGPERKKLPSAKKFERYYVATKKPKELTSKQWEVIRTPEVRQLLSMFLGFKFTPAPEEKAEPTKAKAGKNGTVEQRGTPSGKTIKVKTKMAQDLLVSLGKMQARTWEADKLQEMLENIVNVAEPGQKAETPALQKLLDALVAGYSSGLQVMIVPDGK